MSSEKRRSLPLFWKLLAIIMACWLVLLSVTMAVTRHYSLQTLQEQIGIHDNVVSAVGADRTGETSGRHNTPLIVSGCLQRFREAVQHTVDGAGSAENNACLHAFNRVGRDDFVGRCDLNPGQKRGALCQGVH